MPFDHEKLAVYSDALWFYSDAAVILKADEFKGQDHIRDQFRRAALSIVLNIAEGTGKYHAIDKRRFYHIARGSAAECSALIDVMRVTKLVTDEWADLEKSRLDRIGAMLTALARAMDRRNGDDGK